LLGLLDRLQVAFLHQKVGQRLLELARRHVDAGVGVSDRVTDAREHVCDWIRLHLPSSVGAVSARARRPSTRYCCFSLRYPGGRERVTHQLDLTTPGR